MRIGFIGLGKMGVNMVERLIGHGHAIVAFDISERARQGIAGKGAEVAESVVDMVIKVQAPRIVWVMIPAGKPGNSL